MSILHRRGMGESPNELAGDVRPEREEGAALTIENAARRMAGGVSPGSLTGTTIGHYLVGDRLGGGAMASVYRAYDQTMKRNVAIKVLLPGVDGVIQARFRREARTVSTLAHPHIVRTQQVGRSGGILYIAMELVEGASLGDLLERYGKLGVGDTARLLAPIAQALGYAHEKGIVHRDVKPSNILLQQAAPGAENSVTISILPYPVIPLLTDFGIARALDVPELELTSAGRTIGTPAFMAPEQCAGNSDIDGRADVYALGAVLYRCLVGRAPFSGTTTQILHAHVYDPLLIPDAVADALPAAMVQIMAVAMEKEPAKRYPRIDLMATALQRVAELPEAAAPSPATEVSDSTMTMASLPVAKSPATSTSRVLVAATPPAPIVQPVRPSPLKPQPRVPAAATTPTRAIPGVPPQARKATRRNRWGMMALAGAFALLVILAAGMLMDSVWPGAEDNGVVSGDATPTPAAVAQSGTAQLPVVAPEVSPEPGASANAPDGTVVAGDGTGEVDAEGTPPSSGTATPVPTPSVPLGYAWEQAQGFYADEDWQLAVEWLILVQRILAGTPAPSVDPATDPATDEVDEARVNEMLAISYIGLATDAVSSGKWPNAIEQVENAMSIAPAGFGFGDMVAVLTELAGMEGENGGGAEDRRKGLRMELAGHFATYANELAQAGQVCDAAMLVDNAIQISVSEELQELQEGYRGECEENEATEAIVELGGHILYSTGGGGTPYNIWHLPVTESALNTGQSALIVQNGAQPKLNPNGTMLAYYSRVGGADGLYVVGVNADLTTWGQPVRLGSAPEDSRDSPPSWNAYSTELAYSTSRGSEGARLYVTSINNTGAIRDLGFGKDPAWRLRDDMIAFNGPDGAGQNPGLRAMKASGNGSDRYALTTINGNDQRPTWTSDGKFVVFMSKDRFGGSSWELYRLELVTGDLTLLTDGSLAQDGLPAISPDNKWVAFVSDRSGRWNLYYVSIDGGPVYFLSELNGQPISWLEHSIQWVE